MLRDMDSCRDANHPTFLALTVRVERLSPWCMYTVLDRKRFPLVQRIEVARGVTCSPQLLEHWSEQLDAVMVLDTTLARCKQAWAPHAANIRLEDVPPMSDLKPEPLIVTTGTDLK